MQLRLQPWTQRNLQAQLARTQQGPYQPQHDSTHPQLEKLPCSVVSTGDGDSSVLQDALADDDHPCSSDVERILPPCDRSPGPVDLCSAESFLPHHAFHDS